MTQISHTSPPTPRPGADGPLPVETALATLLAEMCALAGVLPGTPAKAEDEIEAQFDNMPV